MFHKIQIHCKLFFFAKYEQKFICVQRSLGKKNLFLIVFYKFMKVNQ